MKGADQDAADLAINLARNAGFRVFPCRDDKRPACSDWDGRASGDPTEILALWAEFPGPLIGIATGAASGIDVLDIDTAKHEPAGPWWHIAQKRMPPTRQFRSRSGGVHAYFLHAPGVRNSASKVAKGVDVRGSGGYVIHWFSAGLECLDQSPPAAWPDWLRELVRWEPELPPAPRFRAADYGDKAINGAIRVIINAQKGERNAALFWAANRLAERAASGQIGHSKAQERLLAAASSVGLPVEELRKTIGSAFRRGIAA